MSQTLKHLNLVKLLDFLGNRLKGEKPGLSSQLKLAPKPLLSTLTYQEILTQCLKAAVLLLLYNKEGKPHLVFIRRSGQGRHHQNQISFPGGQQQKKESIEQTALREAGEELGLNAKDLLVIGHLTPLYVHTSNYCVFPLVAGAGRGLSFRPCPVEVSEIIEVPLAHLLDSNNLKEEFWTLRGQQVMVPFYQFGEHKIWGATAMILAEFLDILDGYFKKI